MPGEGAKSDLERIGLFSEMEYITIGDKYVSHYDRKYIWVSLQPNRGHSLYGNLVK